MSHDAEVQWEKDYNLQSQIFALNRRLDKLIAAVDSLIDDNAKLKQRLLVLYKDRRMGWWQRWLGRDE